MEKKPPERAKREAVTIGELTGEEYVDSETAAAMLGVSTDQLKLLLHEKVNGKTVRRGEKVFEYKPGVTARATPEPYGRMYPTLVWNRAELEAGVAEFQKIHTSKPGPRTKQ